MPGFDDIHQAAKWSIDRESGSASEPIVLPDLPDTGPVCEFSEANAASEDGTIVVGTGCPRCIGGNCLAFGFELEATRWTGTNVVSLGSVPGGDVAANAFDVTPDGGLAVGTGQSALMPLGTFPFEGFMVSTPGAVQGLGGAPGQTAASVASSVSADGSLLAGAAAVDEVLNTNLAFSLSPASYTAAGGWDFLPNRAGAFLIPGTVRNLGQVNAIAPSGGHYAGFVVSSFTFNVVLRVTNEAIRYREGDSLTAGLGQLAPCDPFVDAFGTEFCGSTAYAISGDGRIVVGAVDSGPPPNQFGARAFIWQEGTGIRSLQDFIETDLGIDLGNWSLTDARGISDDGRVIAGFGVNPSGNTEAFALVVPEPGAAVCHLVSLVTLAGLLRSRRCEGKRPGATT